MFKITDHIFKNNEVGVIGKMVGAMKFSHKVYGEGFYTFDIEIPRLSDTTDIIPVTVSERLILGIEDIEDETVEVVGQFRSYNQYEEGRNRLILTVFALEINVLRNPELTRNKNNIYLDGFVCKKPSYRMTPFGREITDLLIAVNRSYHKSDYIPCISWGRNARYAQHLEVGDNIRIWGRIQSRDYQKKLEDNEVITRTAYEMSISKMERVEESEEGSDEDK